MTARDPSGFNNQPAWLTTREAVDLLGVQRETLYAYVSRGLVQRTGTRTARRYSREDIVRLKARHDARAGHGAVAAGALQWGEPVLETRVSHVLEHGPHYRAHNALELAARDTPFASVAALLIEGTLPASPPAWPAPRAIPAGVPFHKPPVETLLAALALGSLEGDASPNDTHAVTTLLASIAPVMARAFGTHTAVPHTPLAHALLIALNGNALDAAHVRAMNRALVVCADHELNPSTFAARVAASAGAGLYASLAAGAATMTGPRHGRMSDAFEHLLLLANTPHDARAHLDAILARGEALPGFHHALYPHGDPRARCLIEWAHALRDPPPALEALLDHARALHQHPNLDAGLVVLRIAMGLPRGSAAAIFTAGRVAGWIAHVREQHAIASPLRPRARYVGA